MLSETVLCISWVVWEPVIDNSASSTAVNELNSIDINYETSYIKKTMC